MDCSTVFWKKDIRWYGFSVSIKYNKIQRLQSQKNLIFWYRITT